MAATRLCSSRRAGLALLREPQTLPQAMPLTAKALGKDVDVEQYYARALRNDPFCARPAGSNGPTTSLAGARSSARSARG